MAGVEDTTGPGTFEPWAVILQHGRIVRWTIANLNMLLSKLCTLSNYIIYYQLLNALRYNHYYSLTDTLYAEVTVLLALITR